MDKPKLKDKRLVASCEAFCKVEGGLCQQAVFSAVEVDDKGAKRAVYYCGLGKTDCALAHYAQRLNDIAQMAENTSYQAGYANRSRTFI